MPLSEDFSAEQLAALQALELGPIWEPLASLNPPVVDTHAKAPAGRPSVGTVQLASWDALQVAVSQCQKCGLCNTRTQTVFGVGQSTASWMVVGEAPGEQEDRTGEPFVGPAGKLLDAMMASVGVTRDTNLFIANTLKCRPPNNRDPSPEEMAACRPYLESQVAQVDPQLILLMGRAAVASVLESTATIASLRGRTHEVTIGGRSRLAVVTYHPAYLLRNLAHKDRAWRDLVLAKEALLSSRA